MFNEEFTFTEAWTGLVEIFSESPFEKQKINANISFLEDKDYQLCLGNDVNDETFPQSLVIISKNPQAHYRLGAYLASITKDPDYQQFRSTHDTEALKGSIYGAYIIKIAMNEAFHKLFRNDLGNLRDYYNEYRKKFVNYQNKMKLSHTKLVEEFLLSANPVTYETKESLINKLEERKAGCGTVYPQVNIIQSIESKDELQQTLGQLSNMYMVINKNAKDVFFSQLQDCTVVEDMNDKLLISFSTLQMNSYSKQYSIHPQINTLLKNVPTLNNSALKQQIDNNLKLINELETEYNNRVRKQLNDLIARQFVSQEHNEVLIDLYLCIVGSSQHEIQQDLWMGYRQCQVNYLFANQIKHPLLVEKLNEILDPIDIDNFEVYGETILRDTGFLNDHYDQLRLDGDICTAWEHNLRIRDVNQELSSLYENHFARPLKNNRLNKYVSIPLPNLALYYLLHILDNSADPQYQAAKNKAREIILQYKLVVPEKYRNILKDAFTVEQQNELESRYLKEKQEAYDKRSNFNANQRDKIDKEIESNRDRLASSQIAQEQHDACDKIIHGLERVLDTLFNDLQRTKKSPIQVAFQKITDIEQQIITRINELTVYQSRRFELNLLIYDDAFLNQTALNQLINRVNEASTMLEWINQQTDQESKLRGMQYINNLTNIISYLGNLRIRFKNDVNAVDDIDTLADHINSLLERYQINKETKYNNKEVRMSNTYEEERQSYHDININLSNDPKNKLLYLTQSVDSLSKQLELLNSDIHVLTKSTDHNDLVKLAHAKNEVRKILQELKKQELELFLCKMVIIPGDVNLNSTKLKSDFLPELKAIVDKISASFYADNQQFESKQELHHIRNTNTLNNIKLILYKLRYVFHRDNDTLLEISTLGNSINSLLKRQEGLNKSHEVDHKFNQTGDNISKQV